MNFYGIEYAEFDSEKVALYAKKMESIFDGKNDPDKLAFLNWRVRSRRTISSKFAFMGKSYLDTAYYLLQQCLYDNTDKKSDSWIFSIMFNITHGIEVYLKSINVAFKNIFYNEYIDISKHGHDLKKLCNTSKTLITNSSSFFSKEESYQMIKAIDLIENFIKNIYAKTSDMTFSRYTHKKDCTHQFYIGYENQTIDLELLSEQLTYVYNMLYFISSTAENLMDHMSTYPVQDSL